MRYLITGGCGFIGSHLCDALVAQGHTLVVLDNLSTGRRENLTANVELVEGCITNAALVNSLMRGVDGCFHLAAIASVEKSRLDWSGCHQINQSGTVNILEAARSGGVSGEVPVVYASSAAIYGNNAEMPLAENATPSPISAYGVDKLGSEGHARVAALIHQVPTLGLRFFNVYGPRQDPSSPYSGVISIFSDRIRRDEPLQILGDGQQSRDFIFVADIVQILIRAMQHARMYGGHDVVNACTGEAVSLLQLVQTLAAVTGKQPVLEHLPPRPGDIRSSIGSARKLREVLGYSASISLGQGLQQMFLPEPVA